jgi:hypothetical protein
VMGDCIPTMLAAVYGIAVPDSPRCLDTRLPAFWNSLSYQLVQALRLGVHRLGAAFS